MAEALVRNESPIEYFRELVEATMQRQHLSARQLTSFYLVNLLSGFVHFDRFPAAGDDDRWLLREGLRGRHTARRTAPWVMCLS